MAFALAAGIITQSGSDLNLAGLGSIAGVTVTINGDHRVYDIHELQLVITGILDHDPDIETLISNRSGNTPSVRITAAGRHNYGTLDMGNGASRHSAGTGMIFTGLDSIANAEFDQRNYGAISVEGGQINYLGGVILSSRGFGFYSSTTQFDSGSPPNVNITDTKFTKIGTDARREIRFDGQATPQGAIRGMIVDGFQISHRGLPITFEVDLINSQVVQLARGPELATLSNFVTSGNINTYSDLSADSHDNIVRAYEVIGASAGSGTRFLPKRGIGNARQLGYAEIKKAVRLAIQDSAGAAVEGAAVFLRDTNNFFRKFDNGIDNTADKIYFAVSDAQGEFSGEIITAITNINSNNQTIPDQDSSGFWDIAGMFNNAFKVDRRGLDDTTDDRFLFHVWSYSHLPGQIPAALKGTGELIINWTLFADPAVTLPFAQAGALTSLFTVNHASLQIRILADATLDELYDFIKLNKLAESNIQIPSISELLATPDGRILNLRNYNVIVMPGAALRAGPKFGALETTGTVSGDGEIFVGVADANGVLVTIQSNVADTRMFLSVQPPTGNATEHNVVSGADGRLTITLPVDSVISLVAKAEGYEFRRRTFDTRAALDFALNLSLEASVDIAQDITIADGLVSIAYIPAGPTQIIFGEVNLSNRLAESKRVFDRLFSSAQGIEFLFNYNLDGSLDAILDGRPYQILSDRIIINPPAFTFLRGAGLSRAQKSRFGITVVQLDGTTPIEVPDSNNDDVRIDNLTNPLLLNRIQAALTVETVTQDQAYIDALTGPTVAGVVAGVDEDLESIRANTIELIRKLGSSILLPKIGAHGGNEHGVLGVPGLSAVWDLYATERVLSPDIFSMHITWEEIRQEEGDDPLSYSYEVYALIDVNAEDIDFVEDGIENLTAFRTQYADRLMYQRSEDTFVAGDEEIRITVPFNRLIIISRNNNPTRDTVSFRSSEPRLEVFRALQQLVENQEDISERQVANTAVLNGLPDKIDVIGEPARDEEVGLDFITGRGFLDGFSPSRAEAISGDAAVSNAAYLVWRTQRGGEDAQINDEDEAEISIIIGQILDGDDLPVGQDFRFHVYALPPGIDAPNGSFSFATAQAYEIQHSEHLVIDSLNEQNPGRRTAQIPYTWDKLVIWFRNEGDQLNVDVTDVMVTIRGIIQRTLSNSYDTRIKTDRLQFNDSDEVSATGTGGAAADLTDITANIEIILQRIGTTSGDDGTADILSRLFATQNNVAQLLTDVGALPQNLTPVLDAVAALRAVVDGLPTEDTDISSIDTALTRISQEIVAVQTAVDQNSDRLNTVTNGLISQADIDLIKADALLARQILANNYIISDTQFRVLADDGIAVLRTFALTDAGRTVQ